MNTPANKPVGHFVITLDFELYWGVRDSRSLESYRQNILGVRQAMPAMLDSFERHGVKVTFATVGFLFCRNRRELNQYRPSVLPDYPDPKFSPFENGYMDLIGESEADDPYHYGASLLDQIRARPGHEIGTHTFSHYYCLEGSSLEAFRADLEAAKRIAHAQGIGLESIVFPRNQYNGPTLEACARAGISSYRGNEEAAVYQPRASGSLSPRIRLTRLLDSYINLTGHHDFELRPAAAGQPLNIPASRFLRPYMPQLKFLEGMKVKRICDSMTHAARQNLVYHLWWHPHNFGANLIQNIRNLDAVLAHYARLRDRHGFESITMKQLTSKYNKQHGQPKQSH